MGMLDDLRVPNVRVGTPTTDGVRLPPVPKQPLTIGQVTSTAGIQAVSDSSRQLSDKDPAVRLNAVKELGKLGFSVEFDYLDPDIRQKAAAALVTALADDDPKVQSEARHWLLRPRVADLVKDEPEFKATIGADLNRLGQLLSDKDPTIRSEALVGFGYISMAKDLDPEVRQKAAEALGFAMQERRCAYSE
jgi:HEAT repeat protein